MNIQQRRIELIKEMDLTEAHFQRKTRDLTLTQRAKYFKVEPKDLTIFPLTLTPGVPRIQQNNLSFFSAIMLLTETAASNNLALFSSAYPTGGNPSVQVEFKQIKPGKAHLVEFNVSLVNEAIPYKFRVFQYPLATFQDITLTKQQIIAVFIPGIPGFTGTLGASIDQTNTKNDNASWMFRSVRISSVG
ncbi:hypothetical protein [Spirosoma arcticum]